MPSELPKFEFICGGKWGSVDFKLRKSLKYLTGVVQILLLTLSSPGSSACLDLLFSPLFFFPYVILPLFSPSSLAECT